MALTDEQRAKLNARVNQNKQSDINADYDEYQEFLRFKEMKRLSSENEENGGTKYCKYCGAIIPANTIICPSCRNKMNGMVLNSTMSSDVNDDTLPIKFDGTPIRDTFLWILAILPSLMMLLGVLTIDTSSVGGGNISNFLNYKEAISSHLMTYWFIEGFIGMFVWCLDVIVEIKQSRCYGAWVWWGLIPPVYLFIRASKTNHVYYPGIANVMLILLVGICYRFIV